MPACAREKLDTLRHRERQKETTPHLKFVEIVIKRRALMAKMLLTHFFLSFFFSSSPFFVLCCLQMPNESGMFVRKMGFQLFKSSRHKLRQFDPRFVVWRAEASGRRPLARRERTKADAVRPAAHVAAALDAVKQIELLRLRIDERVEETERRVAVALAVVVHQRHNRREARRGARRAAHRHRNEIGHHPEAAAQRRHVGIRTRRAVVVPARQLAACGFGPLRHGVFLKRRHRKDVAESAAANCIDHFRAVLQRA